MPQPIMGDKVFRDFSLFNERFGVKYVKSVFYLVELVESNIFTLNEEHQRSGNAKQID